RERWDVARRTRRVALMDERHFSSRQEAKSKSPATAHGLAGKACERGRWGQISLAPFSGCQRKGLAVRRHLICIPAQKPFVRGTPTGRHAGRVCTETRRQAKP